ncbi:hypothetical protein BG005_004104 [Podila minutissima]|nr:hypothetical protein BG005_004104 [Podila minutissima]
MTSIQTIKASLYEGIKSASPYLVPTEIPLPWPRHGDVVIKILASRVVDYFKDMVTGNRLFPSFVPMSTLETTRSPPWPWCKASSALEKSAQLVALMTLTVPYGGFTAAGLKAGQTVVVNRSMGTFGASTVTVALAMGVRRVVAMGLTRTQLDEYVKIYGPRVVHFVPTGDEAKDTEAFIQAAGEGFAIDLVFDRLPPVASFGFVRSAISALCASGTAVLMGGVQANIETFKLEEINEAIDWSAANSGPFSSTTVVPWPPM